MTRRGTHERVAAARRGLLLVAVGAAVLAAVVVLTTNGAFSSPITVPPPATPEVAQPVALEIRLGTARRTRVELASALREEILDPDRVRALLSAGVPSRWVVRSATGTVVYRLSRRLALRAILRSDEDVVRLAARPVASTIAAPTIAQQLRNNCESAALEILLATTGRRIPQSSLQADLPVSGGLDPVDDGTARVWGDPELGYVGRPDGGGTAGGFGVYEGPIMEVAERRGVQLDRLSGRPSAEIVRRVRAGYAVMVWVGLSAGPYGEWRSPAGRRVRVNFGEHTVVLAGVTADGRLRVVNPLEGTREVWTRERFEAMWRLLDRRAVAVPTDVAG
ncbi:C39 family peptidase [Miltoncostaea oceani]|jgi:uncharacterized protein YvpB|uniref:C39 family peptidase n=1 Tax=Miltoncostaea oceani TaxID=2843216 RepID=UPI001C3C4F44|nr:C39 family peptidase [Miltoncostaea oceani]